MDNMSSLLFGWPTLILTLIPIVILVRILVRTSRWSILKVTATAITGAVITSSWLFYASLITNVNYGGRWGQAIGQWLAEKLGDASSFYLLSISLIIWIIVSSMDFIISSARYFINKPYIKEIIVEVEREVEIPKPEKEKPKQAKPKKKGDDDDPGELKSLQEYDDLGYFKLPTQALLKPRTADIKKMSAEEIQRNITTIRQTLADHHVKVSDIQAISGPTVTLYRIYPEKGVKIAAIRNLQEDVAVALNAGKTVRVLTLDDSIGIEVPNATRSLVPIRSLISDPSFTESKAELPIAIGSTIEGKTKVFDLAKAPHLLVAGSTNQGKSVGLNVIAASLLYAKRPSELKMVFIDPKGTEFTPYKALYRHYLAVAPTASGEEEEIEKSIPVSPKDADMVLRCLCRL